MYQINLRHEQDENCFMYGYEGKCVKQIMITTQANEPHVSHIMSTLLLVFFEPKFADDEECDKDDLYRSYFGFYVLSPSITLLPSFQDVSRK